MPSKFCIHCGTPNPGGARFCPSCGKPFEQLPESVAVEETLPVSNTEAFRPPEQPQTYALPIVRPLPPQEKAKAKKPNRIALIIVFSVIAVIVIAAIALIIANMMKPESDYYNIGGDRVPSISYALNEKRNVSGLSESLKDGVKIQSVEYRVKGSDQGMDVQVYLAYLCAVEGFMMRTNTTPADYNLSDGAAIQAWKNSNVPGYMVIVQLDYDTKGYTLTLMRGAGSVSGDSNGNNGTVNPAPQEAPPPSPTPEYVDMQSLLPNGTPSTNSVNGWHVASYPDGTVSVGDNSAIIMPSGKVYILGEYVPNEPAIALPTDCDISSVNGVDVYVTTADELYVVANGSVLYVDLYHDGHAYYAP